MLCLELQGISHLVRPVYVTIRELTEWYRVFSELQFRDFLSSGANPCHPAECREY
jgi:hypothetical protein